MLPALHRDHAVDHGEVVARGALHPAASAAGEVVAELGDRQRQGVEVDHVEVGGAALGKPDITLSLDLRIQRIVHAATKAGTLGLGLICIAVMVKAESLLHVAEALFVFLFMIASAPVGSHLIGRASWRTRVPMDPNTQIDPDCSMFRRNRAR